MKRSQLFYLIVLATILLAANVHAGRWLSRDPMDIPQHMERDPHPFVELNPYTFVGNNPVSRIDPSGLTTYYRDWPFTPEQYGTYGPYTFFVNDGSDAYVYAYQGMDPEFFGKGGINQSDFDFINMAVLKDALAAGGKLALGMLESGIKAAGKCFAKDAAKAAQAPANPIDGLRRIGSALKTDPYHAFPDVVDNFASTATKTQLQSGATLYQVGGSLNGVAGRFEWIVDGGNVTHRLFVPGGTLNGLPIIP
jgi:hypothetical protein